MTVRIRLAARTDADAIAAIYAPIVADTVISFEEVAPDGAEMAKRVADALRAYPWLVCEIDGRVAGYVYATRHAARAAYRWSVDTSVYISEEFRRCGVGRGLYTSLFEILRAQGFVNAYAGVTLPNDGSVGLHEAMGFEKVGVYTRVGYKFGAWHDVGWWQRALRARVSSPDEPRAFSELLDSPEWPALLTSGEPLIREAPDRIAR